MGALLTIPIAILVILFIWKLKYFKYLSKWIVAYSSITRYQKKRPKRFDLYDPYADGDPEKLNFIVPKKEFELESPFPESHLLHAADEIFFYGVNSKLECLVARITRNTNLQAEAWVYLKLANGKTYQLPKSVDVQQSNADAHSFTCGGLQMYYMLPMRRWRIFFNGLLRETSDDDHTDRIVHAKFSFIVRMSSQAFDVTSDLNPKLLANALAKSEWEIAFDKPPVDKLHDGLDSYAQSVFIRGNVNIGEELENYEMCLFGERIRFLGETLGMKGVELCQIMGHVINNGTFFHLVKVSIDDIVKDLYFGFIVSSNSRMEHICKAELSFKKNAEFISTFYTDERISINGHVIGKEFCLDNQKYMKDSMNLSHLELEFNGKKAYGIMLKGKMSLTSQKGISKEHIYKIPSTNPLVINFEEELCQFSELTGGKGSSLGALTRLRNSNNNKSDFIVPKGIVVTTEAYNEFLTDDILNAIKQLENVLYGKKDGILKDMCQMVADEINKASISEKLAENITNALQQIFGDDANAKKFAIRSSATGEDTEQMSAAGQMETFLGISGKQEILKYIKKCWASQFGQIAVNYKRRNGQIINSPMAVVIQEMIPCDVAGVLFTCDPLTGNPQIISITANYGLGESVVSGSEEPDTIEIQRDINDKLVLKNIIIGSKNRRIIMKDEAEGTMREEIASTEKIQCCLSEDMAYRLATFAIKVEKYFRSHRDIEWGFWKNQLYIFQSRPVTTGTGLTDFEIMHEFDAPMRYENERFTVCNVGEVLPGATSSLGMDVVFKYFNILFQKANFVEWEKVNHNKYFPLGMLTSYNHFMFNTLDLFQNLDSRTGKRLIEASMVGLFGRIIKDDELLQEAFERNRKNKKPNPLLLGYGIIQRIFICKGLLKKSQNIYDNYRIPIEKFDDSKELFNYLLHECDKLSEAMYCHMMCTHTSSLWNMFIFSALAGAKGEVNDEVYSDLASLLSENGNVESADVPSAMQSLAYNIGQDIEAKEFKKMSSEEALEWLKSTPSTSGVKFREFLTKHGHRCLKEFDIRSKTWGSHPLPLVKLLQNLVGTVTEDTKEKKPDTYSKMISKLNISLGWKARIRLRFLIPQSRKAVEYRESSKSILIKGMDSWRKGYQHLAKLMVQEGYIPEEDLIYFLILEEIRELFETRSPKIIARAYHRKKLFQEMDKYIFPEMMKGIPKPINIDTTPEPCTDENFMMKGTPVSLGTAKGYVRVALTLEEAALLKPKEILLTYSTDIGWSPYFPNLSGVVTEIGGLISHGAVVSREYGLPCISGLHGATMKFKTGDYVLLDGNKGILQKIPPPSTE